MKLIPLLSRTIAVALCLSVAGAQTLADRAAIPAAQVERSKAPVSAQPFTEEEKAELAARAEQPGKEVTGGALSNLHLTYIVIALAAAVLVLVLK